MPYKFVGPTAGLSSLIAIVATMFTTYLFLASARKVLNRIGPKGIDAATRLIVCLVTLFRGNGVGSGTNNSVGIGTWATV
jgi:small neutral amino acid transporter SnatA (MarC family)